MYTLTISVLLSVGTYALRLTPCTGTLTCGAWAELAKLEDPELQRLAQALPDTVLGSRAESTTAKYTYAFQRWKTWAEQRAELSVFPVLEVHFALYLQHLGETVKSKSAVQEAVSAISWAHQLAGLPPISDSPFVRATLAGLQRRLAKPKVKKEPCTAVMLTVCLAAYRLLSFAAFLRFDEATELRCCDISFAPDSMSVHIRSSKTDQYRQGDSVLVARTGPPTCPVAMLERYFALANLSPSSTRPIFRAITRTKQGERLRASGSLSYTRMRELFLAKLKELGFEPKLFGLHSLRSGGASAAANAGVADRLFKRHGRWRYIKDSRDALLSVSESLRL